MGGRVGERDGAAGKMGRQAHFQTDSKVLGDPREFMFAGMRTAAATLLTGMIACGAEAATGVTPAPAQTAANIAVTPPDTKPTRSEPRRELRRLARIITPKRPLECVPYARRHSGIKIRGNAWTWWRSARNRYLRDSTPRPGAVLVMRRTQRLPYGHVAVVTEVRNSRQIVVDHANWLNRGRIHRNSLVIDMSAENDWSAVRVWYTPGRTIGKRTYAVHGFIHPHEPRSLRLRAPHMRGADVRALQTRLIAAGYALSEDGVFGRRTHDALVDYQAKTGLAADGIAGRRTRDSLGL